MQNDESVLIFDSDPEFVRSLCGLLIENGFRPTVISDIESAITESVDGGYEVAIIEICDSIHRDGLTTMLVHRSSSTELILTGKNTSVATERAARELAPAFYFVKPVDPTDIFAVVVRIVEMRSRRRIAALRRMEQRERVRHG